MKFRITITLTKIFGFMCPIMGFILALKYNDPLYFTAGITTGGAVFIVRKGFNSAVDLKEGKIHPRA